MQGSGLKQIITIFTLIYMYVYWRYRPNKKVQANSVNLNQTAPKSQSDQGLPCLLFWQAFCEKQHFI